MKYLLTLLLTASLLNQTAATEPLKAHDLDLDAPSSTFSFYHTSPESPNGQLLLYTRFDEIPPESPGTTTAGALWVYDRGTQEQLKVVDLYGVSSHNGAMAQWVDNEIVVYQDGDLRRINTPPNYSTYNKLPPLDQICSINVITGEKRVFPIQGRMGHNCVDGWFPISVMHPMNGYHGVYLINATSGEIKPVCKPDIFDEVVPAEYKAGRVPAQQWRLLHATLSPDGQKIMMRMDMHPLPGTDTDILHLMTLINTDGTHPVFGASKPLHYNWYDNNSFAGHAGTDISISMNTQYSGPMSGSSLMEGTNDKGGVYRFQIEPLHRLEWLAPMGNHLGWSPDGNWFASENWYRNDTVVMNLYRKYSDKPAAVLMRNPYGDRFWGSSIHVNPSFSRDGKRIYFTEVVDGSRFLARWVDISPVLANNSNTTYEREDLMNTRFKQTVGSAAAAVLLAGVAHSEIAATASGFATTDKGEKLLPELAVDGNIKTAWGVDQRKEWLQLDLGEAKPISTVSVAWGGGRGRCYVFEIETSADGTSWAKAYSGEHDGEQKVFKDYPLTQSIRARYIRITTKGYDPKKGGGSNGKWTYIAEVKVN